MMDHSHNSYLPKDLANPNSFHNSVRFVSKCHTKFNGNWMICLEHSVTLKDSEKKTNAVLGLSQYLKLCTTIITIPYQLHQLFDAWKFPDSNYSYPNCYPCFQPLPQVTNLKPNS